MINPRSLMETAKRTDEMVKTVSDDAIPCVVSGILIENLLALIDPVCDAAQSLNWDHDHDLVAGSVVLTVRSGSTILIQHEGGCLAADPPAAVMLDRHRDSLMDASPEELLLSWRDSLRIAVYDGSETSLSLIGALERATRLLAAAGIAAGLSGSAASARSFKPLADGTRFHLQDDVGWLPVPFRLAAHLERSAPPFRNLAYCDDASWSLIFPSPSYRFTQSKSIDAVEMLRLIEELPSDAISELADALHGNAQALDDEVSA